MPDYLGIELLQIAQTSCKYVLQYILVQALILMDRHVPEPNHLLHSGGKILRQHTCIAKQAEVILQVLRNSVAFGSYDMCSQIYRCLYRTL